MHVILLSFLPQSLNSTDAIIIALFLLASLTISLIVRKKASQSGSSFFVGNRNLKWYVIGLSMVATTFAADTPLAVAELVGKKGISGNWVWWYGMIGGILTAIFFSHLWRRSRVVTENEFISLRYFGSAAKNLRIAKALYLGVFMNVVIMGWVNLAMITIFQHFFGIEAGDAFMLTAGLMVLVMIYSSISGFLGVVYTDILQFILALTASIVLAYMVLDLPEIGGLSGLKAQIPADKLAFFPSFNFDDGIEKPFLEFLTLIGVVWWASWYPGQEPGGGGYIAQRMAAAKDEKNATLATLFFQIAHICIRPWPWIIVALACMVLYPELNGDDFKNRYVFAMRDHLPNGFKGLMLVGFIGAYMSTISTHLNWGASYIVNDVIKLKRPSISGKMEVMYGRMVTILLMICAAIVCLFMDSISDMWIFIMECGAGLGLVLILRWYWWRINAWSEISATIAPAVFYTILQIINLKMSYLNSDGELISWKYAEAPYSILIVVVFTTATWLIVTYMTSGKESKEERAHLIKFYQQIRPQGKWNTIALQAKGQVNNKSLYFKFILWIAILTFGYNALFIIGNILLSNPTAIQINAVLLAVSGILSFYLIRYKNVFEN